jgi:hypothetical protein
MSGWKGTCHRCEEPSSSYIMSMYNHELICGDCKDKERKRPDYKQAESRDLMQYASGLAAQGMTRQADNVRAQAKRLLE